MSEDSNSSKGAEEIAKKFAEGVPVSLREHLPSTYKGQAVDVILNAATVLLNVDVKNPADEMLRGIIVAGILENLSIDSARAAIEKTTPGAYISQARFSRFLNHLSRNTPELRAFVVELNVTQAVSGLSRSADGEGAVAKKEAPKTGKPLSEKQLLKLARKSWAEGKPVSTETEAALIALAPDFFQNNVLRSVAGMLPPAPAGVSREASREYVSARSQRNKIVSSAEAEIDAIFVKAQPAVLDPASPTYKKDLKKDKKKLESWKRFFTDHRDLFQFFPSLKQSEERVNEGLRALHELSTAPVVSEKSKKENDPLSHVRKAWGNDDPMSDFEELTLCDKVSEPANVAILAAISKITVSEHVVNQKERIIAAGKPALRAICSAAINDAHAHARSFSREAKTSAKERLKLAREALLGILDLGHEFPQIREAFETVAISLDQPYTSNGKISLACSLIEQEKSTAQLKAIPIETGIVSGVFARDRIGQLLTSNKMTPETAEWAVNYLGDCIRRADGEKRAKAISILLQESAAVPLARQRAVEEAASIASKTPHTDQRQISKMLHEFSRKASLGTPEKTLFIDFAQELRKYEGVDPKLFPTTVEERQKAGGAFRKDTTVIMTAFHTAVENSERAAKEERPLADLLVEFDSPAAPKPAALPEPTANVVLDPTVLLTPQTLANKFARGEDMVLEEMDPKIFAGQPAHRILNAANVLLSVKIPEVEKNGASIPNERLELARNRLVASLLSELEEEDVLPVLEKRHGGPLPEGVLPGQMFASVLMGMHNDTKSLHGITREFLSVGSTETDSKNAARAAPGAEPPAAPTKAQAPEILRAPIEPEPVFSARPAAAPEAELEYSQDISAHDLVRMMEESSEVGDSLPDKSVLKALQTLSNSQKPKHKTAAYNKIMKHFLKEGGAGYTQLDMIMDISRHISLPPNDDTELLAGRTIAEGLLSMPQAAKWGPVESQAIRSILASADEGYVNPAVLNKLRKGGEAEIGEALLVLVERAEINGRIVEEGMSLYEIALTELIGMGEEHAVPALFSLAESNCPKPLLLEFLAAYEPEVSGKEAIEMLLAKRSAISGAVFAPQATDAQISDEKAIAAIQVLQFFGGSSSPMDYDEKFVAKGAAKVPAASAIKFLIQGMADSEDASGLEAWKSSLREISRQSPRLAEETESLLMSSFYIVGKDAMGASFDLLSERPSAKQADFFLTLAAAQNGLYSEKAESALANYDFSTLCSAESFAIMRWMHIDNMPPGIGAQLLKEFLPTHRIDAADWMHAQFLSEVFMGSQDPALAAEAREALVATAENTLASKDGISGVDKILGALSSKEAIEVSELATYALASEMRRQEDKFSPVLHKALFKASRAFKQDEDTSAIGRIITAAQAAATVEAMRQVLVPYLAAEKTLSDFSAHALLSSTEGAQQLALAAGMENHPAGIPIEGSLRISKNAFDALSQADTEFSSRALVSLLQNKKDDLNLSAYEALQKAGDSKCPALLELLSSNDSWERYAATKLLPQREEFVQKVMPLSTDADRSVSASAMDYVLSATGAKGLASILSNPDVPEETQQIQQALSTYCARNKPAVLKELLEVAQTEGKEAEETIRALEFFPTDISFPALLTILDSGKSTAAVARETLVQMCWLLSIGVGGEDAENAAHDLFEVYARTTDPEVRDAIVDSARGPFAEFMLEDAIQNKNHAHPALEIFLSTENTTYSVEVAQYLMGNLFLSKEEAEGLPPLWQVLFAADLGRMAEIKPGTTECKVLQEVAELEFMYGQGGRESKELLFAFMQNFGSRQVRDSLFERGPLGVSEFLWAMRNDPSEEKAVLWLRSMKDEKTNLLLDVLVEQNYSALDKLLENPELADAVSSHAMRRALFSFAELSKENGSADEDRAREGLELYSHLLCRNGNIGMPSEREDEFAALQKSIGLTGMITKEGNAKGEGMIHSLRVDIREISSLRASARSDGRRLARQNGSPQGERPLRRVRRISENPS